MTRVLGFGDLHLGAGRDHRVDALADQEAVLEQIADVTSDRGIDLILNAGDTFDRPGASIPALHVWGRFVRRLERLGIPMVSVLGNAGHDQVNSATATAQELYESPLHRVSRHPELIYVAGVQVCTLPSVPVHRLVAQHPELERGNVNELAARLLVETARELHADTRVERSSVLLAHWSIAGAKLPNGLPVADLGEPVLYGLGEIGFDAIVAGHIHNGGLYGAGPAPELYVGSPLCLNFGEAQAYHGCWILDVSEQGAVAEFVPLADRRFVTVDLGILDANEEDLDETDQIAAAISERLPLTDAVLRVRYRATEAQHRRVDHHELDRLLADAGVHKIYGGIRWEPVRSTRARAAGMDETLEPLAAVRAWCETNDVADDDELELVALTERYLEQVPA